jgi:hypothetical protein
MTDDNFPKALRKQVMNKNLAKQIGMSKQKQLHQSQFQLYQADMYLNQNSLNGSSNQNLSNNENNDQGRASNNNYQHLQPQLLQ